MDTQLMKSEIEQKVNFKSNGIVSSLILTRYSGRIIYRDKIDTIIGIKHPGIILGEDIWGTVWVIHNHYRIGHTEIVSLKNFSEGVRCFYDNRPVHYDRYTIVDRAISFWQKKKEYNWLTNNCQHFTNAVARNEHGSDTIDKVSANLSVFGAIIALGGLMSGQRTIAKIGVGLTGAGLATQAISRYRSDFSR